MAIIESGFNDEKKIVTRAHIRLDRVSDANEFVSMLNKDGTTYRYTLEDATRNSKVNARSILGVMYMATEYNNIYLVNETEDGKFPYGVDAYRVV